MKIDKASLKCSAQKYTMQSIQAKAPVAFKQMSLMGRECRDVLLLWLSGQSTSPIGYVELVKEDGHVSELKNKQHVLFCSTKMGRVNKHYMTQEQIEWFFHDLEEMMRTVEIEVEQVRLQKDKRSLLKLKDKRGLMWITLLLGISDPRLSANDDVSESS